MTSKVDVFAHSAVMDNFVVCPILEEGVFSHSVLRHFDFSEGFAAVLESSSCGLRAKANRQGPGHPHWPGLSPRSSPFRSDRFFRNF